MHHSSIVSRTTVQGSASRPSPADSQDALELGLRHLTVVEAAQRDHQRERLQDLDAAVACPIDRQVAIVPARNIFINVRVGPDVTKPQEDH